MQLGLLVTVFHSYYLLSMQLRIGYAVYDVVNGINGLKMCDLAMRWYILSLINVFICIKYSLFNMQMKKK